MWVNQSQTTHDWEWFIPPFYGDLGDSLLLLFEPHYCSYRQINYQSIMFHVLSSLLEGIWIRVKNGVNKMDARSLLS